MRLAYGTLGIALVLAVPAKLQAIPAWSRLTGAPCASCHATPTFQLNKDGLDFLKNGHRLNPLKVVAKDQKLENYFSLIFKARVYNDQRDDSRTGLSNTQRPKTQFEQHSMSIYTGGAVSDRVSYFAELYLSENTGATSGSNVVQSDAARKKLAEAFIQYNFPVGGGGSFISARIGQILPPILHVFGVGARSAEQRAIVLNDALVGNDNTYRPFDRQQGIDATLVTKTVEVSAGVVNGSDASTTNSIDADNSKDIYGSAMVNLDKHASAIGAYYYNGHFTNYTVKQDYSTAIRYVDDFYRAGFMGRFIQDNWRIVGTYFVGNETIDAAGLEAKNSGFYGLVDYNFSDSFGAYVRYDYIDPNTAIDTNEQGMFLIGLDGMIFQNDKSGARWQVEYTSRTSYNGGSIKAAGTNKFTDNRIWFQATFGF